MQNFKCYKEKREFVFDAEVPTLILGESGVGKSTIMEAFFILLYGGTGYGSSVLYLKTPEYAIHRSLKPASFRVTVLTPTERGEEDEDREERTLLEEEAQEFVNQTFGHNFSLTGYISQQSYRSFLLQTPQEKLETFEKLVFSRELQHPRDLRKRMAAKIKEVTIKRAFWEGQVKALDSWKDTQVPAEQDVDFLSLEKSYLELKQKMFSSISAECTFLREQTKEKQFNEKEALSLLSSCLLKNKELEQKLLAAAKLEGKTLWPSYSPAECKETLEEIREQLHIWKEKENLKRLEARFDETRLQKLEEELNKQSSVCILLCPKCQNPLVLGEDSKTLHVHRTTNRELESLRKQRNDIEKQKGVVSSLIDDSEEIELPEILEKTQKWIQEYQVENELLAEWKQIDDSVSLSVRDVENILFLRNNKHLIGAQKRLSLLHSVIDKYKLRDFSSEIRRIPSAQDIDNFVRYKDALSSFENERRRENSLISLKNTIVRAEIEYIISSVKQVEKLANVFAMLLFRENIQIKLVMNHSSTSDKSQIGLFLTINEREAPVKSLSGGEHARMNLAFILAFNQVFESKLLLLDETFSHLDSQTTEMVMRVVKDALHNRCKLILVAHQIVQGQFNDVILLNKE